MTTIVQDLWAPDARKAVLAELVGTFFLALAALIGTTPYAVALTLTAMVYAIGAISGCNINPAVTIGLVSARRLSVSRGIGYVIAQVIGALVAYVVAALSGHLAAHYAAASPWLEFFGFAFLIVTVIAVSDEYVPKSGSGIAIGAALAAGLLTSGGIINPAIAVAMGQTFSGATWAPILSGIAFAWLFHFLASSTPQARQRQASMQDSTDQTSLQRAESRMPDEEEESPERQAGAEVVNAIASSAFVHDEVKGDKTDQEHSVEDYTPRT